MPHAAAQFGQAVEGKGMADGAGQSAQDFPILARFAGREDRTVRQLYTSLGVDVRAVLLGVGSPRQDDIRALRATVAMMSLINHKSPAEIADVDRIRAEQV